ncbi:MAG: TIGR03667 family PPOX class F420-dependent oxidoreductase [Rhodococcus sp.]|jgi:PPOX class probable F420-dependent enzyme|nr:TIGR03667 family PPOX class F420-dependent oxidoreductase [Rhodococcus sp. (in: high G+C Gram-positive bacteria)]
MFTIDANTDFGARVLRRLRDEQVLWLTVVDRKNAPRSMPVWFLWDGETILIYSQPNQLKIRSIEANPNVDLHFNSDPGGGDVVVLLGQARVAPDAPPAVDNAPFVEKYHEPIAGLGMTPQSFSDSYSTPILVTPTRLWGF